MLTQIRERLEEAENKNLNKFAAKSSESKGRAVKEEKCPIRTDFQRDRDRILHSKAFRRLKHKTQVFLSPMDDHYRTRMTHTLEVSQIARTIAKGLNLNEDLTEAIALGHDLGHTPFGHCGESVLNKLMPDGFLHNKQSVRVATVLENINLTYETLDGILNHSGDLFSTSIPKASTLEGQIVKVADKIAYINHDIDDAVRAGVMDIEDLPKESKEYFRSKNQQRIATLIMDVIENSYGINDIKMSSEALYHFNNYRRWMFENIYLDSPAKMEEGKARHVIAALFEFYLDMLKSKFKNSPEEILKRIICDYIAGMTDRYAITMYEEYFVPKPTSAAFSDLYLFKMAELNGLK
ncbi:deoxyguanosinetriphosphate triphosphohydrolase [bacterium]|nr:deoxyguanosinetriphosphate triphosphohydrolase [bacterium]